MVLSTLVDTFYQAGEYNMERSQDPCELAVWDDTVSQLLMNGYIKRISRKDRIGCLAQFQKQLIGLNKWRKMRDDA